MPRPVNTTRFLISLRLHTVTVDGGEATATFYVDPEMVGDNITVPIHPDVAELLKIGDEYTFACEVELPIAPEAA